MSSLSIIDQLIQGADGKIEHAILNSHDAAYFAKHLKQAKIPALMIDNRLPIGDGVDNADVQTLRSKGVEFYPAGRTGNPALVAAEDGLAVPGTVIVTTDFSVLELSVLGARVILLEKEEMLELLESGSFDLTAPEVKNIILTGQTGDWTGGIDIALYLEKYFELPKDMMLEVMGEGLAGLALNERFNLARTLAELGYRDMMFQVDEAVMAFLQDRTDGEGKFYFAEAGTEKEKNLTIELQKIHPMIAWNDQGELHIGPLTEKDNADIDLIFIGGDTACRFDDIQEGLKLIRYRPLADHVNGTIIPGSQLVYGDLLDMGIAGILTEIGFDILPSSFMELIAEKPAGKRVRLGTSLRMLHSGDIAANALSCFSAAMTGHITHPLELESILKQEEQKEHEHEHEHGHE